MRIWSVHPKYLDAKGIVALWRETLLAKNVLEGNTKGYKNHPQLTRFKAIEKPLEAINQYLAKVWDEATRRGYNFDRNKIDSDFTKIKIEVTTGQMQYEFNHLLKKLEQRDPERFKQFENLKMFDCAEIFEVKEGEIEKWEIIS
ncbi:MULTISPECIES: pyrimidine dimer DNA glycosylase/endonuclease V [unclassified Empedobacter]|uniref:pyrimidine dimer DNA glycosylase/endonuclease V n=1 Tax=unclassified Empedobacter TaxID=2643773 RepID=UPI0025C39036|nr:MULTISPECIES: pyrimidine dimer DNA glycosylase/endonuclease V [unclassified Empedobacter]